MRMRLCSLIFFLYALQAGASVRDSLNNVLKAPGLADSSRVFTLLELGEYYYNSEGILDSSIRYYERALVLAKKTKRNDLLADSYSGIALLHREKGIFDKALKNYLKALDYSLQTKTVRRIAREYNGIAVVHAIQNDLDKALEYYRKSEAICVKENYKPGLASVYNNMGLAYVGKKNHKKALEYYTKGLVINRENKSMRGVATNNENIGLIYLEFLHQPTKSLEHFYESVAIWRSMNDRNSVAITLLYIAMALTEKGEYQKSADTLRVSLKLAREVGSLASERDVYFHMHNAYEKMGDMGNAYKYYKRWNSLSDSLKNDDKLREITSMQVEFEMNQKSAVEKALYARKMEEEKTRYNWLMGGLGLVVLFAIVLSVAFLRNRRAKKEIAGQKLTIEQRNREVMDSIRYASRIQNAILPPDDKMQKVLRDHFVFYQPKDIVSGDFYWIEEKDDLMFIAVVDCTGHGVPGAFMSIMGRNGLHEAVHMKGLYRPNEILDFLNQYVKEAIHQRASDKIRINDGMDLSLCVLNRSSRVMEVAGANNPVWIFRASGNSSLCSVIEIPGDKQPIGSHDSDHQKAFSLHEITLQANDLICMFTDGYADQFGGPKGKKIKYTRLKQMLQEKAQTNTQQIRQYLSDYFYQWKGDLEQIDDVCIMGIKV